MRQPSFRADINGADTGNRDNPIVLTFIEEYGHRPRLLDLFSGAGGAAMGYHRAGFEVVGVNNKVAQKCKVPGCNLNLRSHGYCRIHWGRFKNRGTTDALVRTRHDYTDKKGYVRRYVDGKRQGQYVHRLVMEEMLGRELLPGETVHHKNDINGDNEPDNLELWASLHPKGSRVIDLLEFAHLVIERYEKNT